MQRLQISDQFIHCFCAEVAFRSTPDADSASLDVFVADDEHDRNFLHLVLPDALAHFLVPVVVVRPETRLIEEFADLRRSLMMLIGNRD